MYLTFPEYLSFGGTLSEIEFNKIEYDAEVAINYATFNRLKGEENIPEEVKRLMVVLVAFIDLKGKSILKTNDSANSGNIIRQSNDGVEVQYGTMTSAEVITTCQNEVSSAIKEYLNGVKNSKGQLLLYRGLYAGE